MTPQTESLLDIPLRRIDGTASSLAAFKGKVLLIVNVASECGLTPQYEALQALYERYSDRGLEILGFPANEFGAQEPGSNDEIAAFCRSKFGIEFPMFEKIVVKGIDVHPLYQTLTRLAPEADTLGDTEFASKMASYGIVRERANDVLWNFEKFVVNREGEVVARFAPNVKPDDPAFVAALEKLLGA